jgi:hypothetical protein
MGGNHDSMRRHRTALRCSVHDFRRLSRQCRKTRNGPQHHLSNNADVAVQTISVDPAIPINTLNRQSEDNLATLTEAAFDAPIEIQA